MRRYFLTACLLALLAAGAQTGRGADVSVDFFYNNLSGGSWIEVGDYGYCWQPDVAVNDPAWRPYSDGYWAYTDLGWTWVSYEDFGWATYHYGRWTRLADYGWIWVPGRDEDLNWGPAWVSWRTGGEYIGWAPLPPETIGVVEGGPVEGDIDVRFNIGPAYYNFVDVRYIGEPVLRERIVDYRQNVTYVNETVNVTNITYKNKVVYNYGPDVNVVDSRAARPIQRLKIERQDNVDLNTAVKSGSLVKPQGDRLVVAAPMHIQRAQRQVAPPTVKAKVAKANFDRGWSEVGDQNAQNQFKERLRTQQTRKAEILADKANPAAGAAGQAGVSPGPSAPGSNAANARALERGQGRKAERRNEALEQRNAGVGVSASTTPVAGASASPAGAISEERQRGKGNRQQFPSNKVPPTSTAGASPAETTAGAQNNGLPAGDRHNRNNREQAGQSNVPGGNGPNDLTGGEPGGGRGRRMERPAETKPVIAGENKPDDLSSGQSREPRGRRIEHPGETNPNLPAENKPNDLSGGRGARRVEQPGESNPNVPHSPDQAQGGGGRERLERGEARVPGRPQGAEGGASRAPGAEMTGGGQPREQGTGEGQRRREGGKKQKEPAASPAPSP